MSIDIATARKVAKLARIRVPEENLPKLADQLSGILGFMEQQAAVLKNAPEAREGFFVVPKVVE
mgnify:CR=1 FL=1